MATFSERKTALDDAATRVSQVSKSVANGVSSIQQGLAVLQGMPADYTAIFAEIAADPGSDAATELQKAEAVKLVAEFIAKKDDVQAIVDAIGGV